MHCKPNIFREPCAAAKVSTYDVGCADPLPRCCSCPGGGLRLDMHGL
jgi:hypothetical protein